MVKNPPVVLLTDCRAYSYVSARIHVVWVSLFTFVSAKYCILFNSIFQKSRWHWWTPALFCPGAGLHVGAGFEFLVSVNKLYEVLLDKCCFIKVKSSSLSCLLELQLLVSANPLTTVVLEKNYHWECWRAGGIGANWKWHSISIIAVVAFWGTLAFLCCKTDVFKDKQQSHFKILFVCTWFFIVSCF